MIVEVVRTQLFVESMSEFKTCTQGSTKQVTKRLFRVFQQGVKL